MCKNKLAANRRENICLECVRVVRTQMSKSNKVDATLDGSDIKSDLSMTFSSNKKSICEEYPLASVK